MKRSSGTPHEDTAVQRRPDFDLSYLGITNYRKAYWNLSTAGYVEESIGRNESVLTEDGALVVRSGHQTARAAGDKFIVRESSSEADIYWGEYNQGYQQENFNQVFERMKTYLEGKDIFVQDGTAGISDHQQLSVRVISTWAWHGLFTRNMFHTPETVQQYANHRPEFTVLSLPDFQGDPIRDRLNSTTLILIDFSQRLVLIGDTGYGGEIKKSIFTALNYYFPKSGTLTMHCSANVGGQGDTALFFGLSGTGKTTLSADPNRQLIGDDEHGWDDQGVFNFEDGSYAKVINLSSKDEPDIFRCTHQFGTILENVPVDPISRKIDLFDDSITRNTRASYPLKCIPYALPGRQGEHPKNIVFLTFDANGVMPPIARLSLEQALYHFISGYTSKVGGTEAGVGETPQITFSACFGAPFMVFHPSYYAELLRDKLTHHQVSIWLINTGLVGGGAGTGSRISISHTRSLLSAALAGDLDQVSYREDPFFHFQIPETCPGVPDHILKPDSLWNDKNAYQHSYRSLAKKFQDNFQRFEKITAVDILAGGPSIPEQQLG